MMTVHARSSGARTQWVIILLNVLVVAFSLWALYLQNWHLPYIKRLTHEDGPLENLTAICYAVAAGSFLVWCVRERFRNVCGWGFFLMFFVVAGEEISWGQRCFGWTTPPMLDHINEQHELNFHNIEGINSNVRLAGLCVQAVICVLIPLMFKFHARFRTLALRRRVPIVPFWVTPIVLISAAFMAYPRVVLGRIMQTMDETGEFLIGVAMLAFAISIWVRTRQVPLRSM